MISHGAVFLDGQVREVEPGSNLASGVLDGIQQALDADADLYEQHDVSPFAEYALSKVVFLRLAMDDTASDTLPQFQLALETISHDVSAAEAEAGIMPDKIAPYDGVKVKLLDNATNQLSSWSFDMLPRQDSDSLRPSFHHDTYKFGKVYHGLAQLAHTAYNIAYAGNIQANEARSPIKDLEIITQTLREGRLDTRTASWLRRRGMTDSNIRWQGNNLAAIRGAEPHFKELTAHALHGTDFAEQVRAWQSSGTATDEQQR